MFVHRLLIGTVFALALPHGAAAQNKDLDFLHVLVVADTVDKNIGKSVGLDARTIPSLLAHGIPDNKLSITVLTGANASGDAIFKYYANLPVGPNQGVMFYYAGHGGLQDAAGKQHVLALNSGGVSRTALRNAMLAKRPELLILITDCCSTLPRRQGVTAVEARPLIARNATNAFKPGFRELFFQSRGVVNITAADDGEPSMGDNTNGGTFTVAFAKSMLQPHGHTSWLSFYPYLKDHTEEMSVKIWGIPPDRAVQSCRAFGLPGTTWGFHTVEERRGMKPNESITVKVREVYPESPAHAAGLDRFDVVLKINGARVTTNHEVIQAMAKVNGDSFKITVRTAGGQEVERELKRR